jgi:hypothetical protein
VKKAAVVVVLRQTVLQLQVISVGKIDCYEVLLALPRAVADWPVTVTRDIVTVTRDISNIITQWIIGYQLRVSRQQLV